MMRVMGSADSQAPSVTITELSDDRLVEAVDVLVDAFVDYPVMRYVIGSAGEAYRTRLRRLLEFFTSARFLQDELVTGAVTGDNVVVGVANSTLPGVRRPSLVLGERRETVWRELGDEARTRYEAYGKACEPFAIDRPNYHLSMIGVRRTHVGMGLARRLLDDLHEKSRRDATSCGVTLTTEDPNNVALYHHFGYQVVGHARVTDGLESWGFFRPDAEG